jgi:hypothetical protein
MNPMGLNVLDAAKSLYNKTLYNTKNVVFLRTR